MFSVEQKRSISRAVQQVLRDTNHPELPTGEIQFKLHVDGAENWSWADIKNNGAVPVPDVNPHNEAMTPLPTPAELRESATALDDAYNDFGQGYGFEETANHLRQFADLIEQAEKGVTDDVIDKADRAAELSSQPEPLTELQKVMRTNDLNRRAEVEIILLDISSGKRDLPTREECKELALRLGVPEVWKESQLTESHCNCVVCYERGHEITVERASPAKDVAGQTSVPESLAYIEIGEGYFDIGTDLSDETLRRVLGPGKHHLTTFPCPPAQLTISERIAP